MAANTPFLFLAVCLLLGKHSSAHNKAPCQPSTWNNAYNQFVRRHVCSDRQLLNSAYTSYDQNKWQDYICRLGLYDRPTQSFLCQEDLKKVKAVCTKTGGKVYKDNLCISIKPFKFVTVRSELNTCNVISVKQENKHLILACDMLGNQLDRKCLPVHFQRNPGNHKPRNNARPCQ